MNSPSDPCREWWLTQRRAGDRWAHRVHCALQAVGVRSAAASPVAVVAPAPASAAGAAPAPGAAIDGRARFDVLTPSRMRLGHPAAGDEFPDGKTFGVVGSDDHGDINIDSVAVTEADQLMAEELDVLISTRAGGQRDQVTSP